MQKRTICFYIVYQQYGMKKSQLQSLMVNIHTYFIKQAIDYMPKKLCLHLYYNQSLKLFGTSEKTDILDSFFLLVCLVESFSCSFEEAECMKSIDYSRTLTLFIMHEINVHNENGGVNKVLVKIMCK